MDKHILSRQITLMACSEFTHHCKELLRQGVVVREELEWCGGRQGGGRLVMMVVMMVGIAEASTH